MIFVKEENRYKGVYAQTDLGEGWIVCDLLANGKLILEPTRTSIQVNEALHVEDEIGGCINHSCQPSCKVTTFFVIALRDIKKGEEITFDYNQNEDALANPFECSCCGKIIRGKNHE